VPRSEFSALNWEALKNGRLNPEKLEVLSGKM